MDLLLVGFLLRLLVREFIMLLFNGHDYKDNLWEVFMIWHGGIAIYGALIGSIIGSFFLYAGKGI